MKVMLGGGLAGLSAGYVLSQADQQVVVFESDATVGGLSKTIVKGDFRFDLGGHRFFTKSERINRFISDLMEDELVRVPRSSKICLRNKYFDYPLKPINAIFGLGIMTTLKILVDYGHEKLKNIFRPVDAVSLEDWVVTNFGRTMFNIYFKEYSEKVWGIDCNRISAEWVAKRIQGLSLGTAIKNAFFKFDGKEIPTLADRFAYPALGIGRISDRLRDEIERKNRVVTEARVERLNHAGWLIDSAVVDNGGRKQVFLGSEFVSSIPMTTLVGMLHPKPPDHILTAASKLKYRDLVIVAVMLDRPQVTDQSWIYIPEQEMALGRIHEPKNWSSKMAPKDKTLVVAEYFSFKGDHVWNATDEELTERAGLDLEKLGFIERGEVIDSVVVRVPKAYPLFEVGYQEHYDKLWRYLQQFKNLHLIGRGGTFKYLNIDHTLETGIETAESLLKSERTYDPYETETDRKKLVLAGDVL